MSITLNDVFIFILVDEISTLNIRPYPPLFIPFTLHPSHSTPLSSLSFPSKVISAKTVLFVNNNSRR